VQQIFMVMIAMVYLVDFYEISLNGIARWESQIVDKYLRSGYYMWCMKRLIKCLRPTFIPVGSVGIFDKDIKVNYLERTFGSTIDVILATE